MTYCSLRSRLSIIYIYSKFSPTRSYMLLAVLVFQQAMIIAFTSDMIPRLVYYWSFSVYPYGDHADHTMQGYISSSLSVFNTSDFTEDSKPEIPYNITTCRYKD